MDRKLGPRIRTFRERKDMTREQLAEQTGFTPEFIADLEDRNLYPSLTPLLKVSRALGVRLGTFMDDAQVSDPLVVRRAERETVLSTHSGLGKRETVRFQSLGRGKPDRHMEPFCVELLPEGDEPQAQSSHQGEEFIVVTKGRVKLVYGRDEHVLEPGDSVYFNSVVPHHVGCKGDEPAEIYAVLYFPE